MVPPEELQYGLDMAGIDTASLGDALREVLSEAMTDPMRMALWASQMGIAQQTAGINLLQRLSADAAKEALKPSPAGADKRFSDPGWQRNPFVLSFAETYLEQAKAAMSLVDSSRLPEATRRKAHFAMQLMTDALAPSNVPWINPAVVREAMDTGGTSLVHGLENFLADVKENGGVPRQVDTKPFELGSNIAATPGRVVFRNELIELLAFEPQTPQVHAIPLLCSPPWINKYYVMDLAPGRSFIEWAVKHGHQTFAISYRNPDASMAAFTMDDYVQKSLVAALGAIERITGTSETNIAALCLGGTLTLITLAYLEARGEGSRVHSATVTNTLIDFAEPGDLGVFTDETTIARLEKQMSETGYLDSADMAQTFNLMRSNDLIWNYVVSSWYQGKNPPAFDILYWNNDSTRMPAAMHSQYLRTCYLNNSVVQPGAVTIGGVPIDLAKIRTPLYVLGAEGDHIAPWRSTYRTVNHVSSDDIRYTLSNSGHIAGIVNPPGGKKSEHWTRERADRGQTADEWRASAERHTGTWWENWALWADAHAGPMVTPPKLPQGEPAPGVYVRNETAPPFDPVVAAPEPPASAPKPKTAPAPLSKNGRRRTQPRGRSSR
jgi:polyhydroxyalkanoate synthase